MRAMKNLLISLLAGSVFAHRISSRVAIIDPHGTAAQNLQVSPKDPLEAVSPTERMVLFVGDSATLYSSGGLAKEGTELGFGQILQRKWAAKLVCWGLSGYNAEWASAALEKLIPGNETYLPYLTERVTKQDFQNAVDLVVIFFGLNDANQNSPPGITHESYADHLRVMLKKLWQWNERLPIVLVGPPLLYFYEWGKYDPDYTNLYNQEAEAVFGEFKKAGSPIAFVDLAGGTHDRDSESIIPVNMDMQLKSVDGDSIDGLHFNTNGNAKMAAAIENAARLLRPSSVGFESRSGKAPDYYCPELAGPGKKIRDPREQIFKKWSELTVPLESADDILLLA